MQSSITAFGLALTSLIATPLAACHAPESNAPDPEARLSSDVEPSKVGSSFSAPVSVSSEASDGVSAGEAPKAPSPADAIQSEAKKTEAVETEAVKTEIVKTEAVKSVTVRVTQSAPPPIIPAAPAKVVQVPPVAGPMPPENMAPDDGKSMFGEPLYVNGQRITDNQIKLWIIYGPSRMVLEMYRVGLIAEQEIDSLAARATDTEIARREAEKPFASPGEKSKARSEEIKRQRSLSSEKFTVTEADIDVEFNKTTQDFKENYPVLDTNAEISRAFRNPFWYRQQLRQTMLFDKVFLPENPEEWPLETVESLNADSEVWMPDARDSYKMRKEQSEKTGTPMVKEDSLYANMLRQIVRDAMYSLNDFKTNFDGLPDSLALTADTNLDGKPDMTVTTEEVWQRIADTVSAQDIDDAKRWYVTWAATRDRLADEGHFLATEERKSAMAAYAKTLEGTYLTVDLMATQNHYFPSPETYKEYYCLMEGFKEVMKPQLQPGPGGDLPTLLREHFEKANKIMGLGQVDPEVMLVAAFDIPHFKWKTDGWSWAKKKADALVADLNANNQAYADQRAAAAAARAKGEEYKPEKEAIEPYRYWTQIMDDNSEWWDPPPPSKAGQRQSDIGYKKKGRFGPRYRHDLCGVMGENAYRAWTTGQSITDYVFFEQAENSVAGPFKGSLGYYITRVNKRMPPTRPMNLSDPKHVDLLRDDFLRVAFVKYAQEAIARAKVKGF